MRPLLVLTSLAACSGGAPSCPGAAPTMALVEGYCTAGEADRCYFDQKPLDGFWPAGLGVGRSLGVYYRLERPLAQGGLEVAVTGYTSADDAHLQAELVLVSGGATDGGSEQTLATLDGPPAKANGTGPRTWIRKTACVSGGGQVGDALLLRISYLGGSSLIGSISTKLTLP